MEGRLYFNTKDSNRPIECKYAAEINVQREYFVDQHQAILYLYDNGVQQYRYLTKEYEEYKDPSKIMVYEIWHIGNRLGYVLNDYEQYLDDNCSNWFLYWRTILGLIKKLPRLPLFWTCWYKSSAIFLTNLARSPLPQGTK